MFSCFLNILGAKKLRKNRVFLTPRKPKTTVFAVFFAPGTKNHGVYSVLWPAPSKNSGIYAVFSMLQDVLLPGQTHKNTVNYSVSAFETRWKPSRTTNKCPKWSISFGPKKPGKRQVGFWALPPRLRPHLSKTDRFRASPPTPPRLASLRLYLYSSPGLRLAFVIYVGKPESGLIYFTRVDWRIYCETES